MRITGKDRPNANRGASCRELKISEREQFLLVLGTDGTRVLGTYLENLVGIY
jgi:hypothetical protein